MKKLFSLFTMAMVVMFLAASCKKDSGSDEPPVDNEPIETQPHVLKPVTRTIGNNVDGYFEALPSMYNQTTKKYPLLIYFHGSGQIGNGSTDLPKVLNAGAAKVLNEKRFPPNIVVNGQNFSFIVLMPQFRGQPSNADVKSFVDFAKANYRYDVGRVYLSGSSMGARALTEFAATYPTEQTAIVPLAGALFFDLNNKAKNIATNKVAAWLFHNENDLVIAPAESRNFVNAVNSFNPAIPAKLTMFPNSDSPQGHDAWTLPTNPDYREHGKSIYEWMLMYKK